MRILPLFGLGLLLAGCGVVYQSTAIREGLADGSKVRVIEVTPETLIAANNQTYVPRALPAAFHSTAGTYGSGRGAGELPEPAYSPVDRGALPETRLPPAVAPGPYRIGVGDVVLLATKAAPTTTAELSGLLAAETRRQGYTVQDDGSIAIPDVGRVRIGNLTLEEAEGVVFRSLLEYQIDPAFSLEIAEFNARRVTIGGSVVSPGVVPVTLTPLTLDTALATVGGVNVGDRASAAIRIYRDGVLYQIPVESFLTNAAQQKIRLIDGDSVFVDAEYDLKKAEAFFSEQIRLGEFKRESRMSALNALNQEVALRRNELSEQRETFNARLELGAEGRDYVYLTGEVRVPGRMALPFEQTQTLADALFGNGGGLASRTGNPRQIYVLRGSADPREFDSITAWHLNAGSPAGMVLATRMELRPNDVVFVAEQPVTRWSRTIDQISPSLIAIPINEAIGD